jgi:hypothetical protein
MDIPFDWIILFLFILFLGYAMFAIKREMNNFDKDAVPFELGPFCFPIPRWWSIKEQENLKVIFERQDTRYDWFARYQVFEDQTPEKELPELLIAIIKEKDILFDEQNSWIMNPSDYKEHPLVKNNKGELVHIEGTATQNGIERLYYDVTLIRDYEQKLLVLCESQSSVLNGLVEGPFFEESLKRFYIKEAPTKQIVDAPVSN